MMCLIVFFKLNCIFPFIFNGNWTDTCLEKVNQPNNFWCSLDRVFANRSVSCEQSCPLLARNAVKDNPSLVHTMCLSSNAGAIPLFPDSSQIAIILNEHNKGTHKIHTLI